MSGEACEAGEEAASGAQCGECGAGDPAVLALGPARRPLVYPRDLLLRLRHSPLVKRGLEHAFRGCDAALALSVHAPLLTPFVILHLFAVLS